MGVTSFHRRNLECQLWDNAGHIDWSSNTTAKVCFGTDEVLVIAGFIVISATHSSEDAHARRAQREETRDEQVSLRH